MTWKSYYKKGQNIKWKTTFWTLAICRNNCILGFMTNKTVYMDLSVANESCVETVSLYFT